MMVSSVIEPSSEGRDADSQTRAEPRYITRGGLRRLEARIADMRRASKALAMDRSETAATERHRWQGEIAELNDRLRRVIPVDLPESVPSRVQFGVTVRLLDEFNESHAVTLVGEDEIDLSSGRISWLSPLGRALTYRAVGDLVTWQRGMASVDVEIIAIEL